jgi:hypothetical protein
MVQLGDKIIDVIEKYAKSWGFQKAELKISNGSKNGDSFSGDVSKVLVQDAGVYHQDSEENDNEM